MASTNKTTTLQLNQWVATDPVLREDFNSDNTKIDTSIRNINTNVTSLGNSVSSIDSTLSSLPLKKFTEHSFTSSTARVDINLGANLWDYSRASIAVSMRMTATAAFTGIRLLLNGIATESYYAPYDITPRPTMRSSIATLYAPNSSSLGSIFQVDLCIMKNPGKTTGTIYIPNMPWCMWVNSAGESSKAYVEERCIYIGSTSTAINTINFVAVSGNLAGGNVSICAVRR